MGDPRPLHDGHDSDSDRQYRNLRETGNGPTHPDEEALLREMFGEPDEDGTYGGVT